MDITQDRSVLQGKLIPELQQITQTLGIEGAQKLRKAGLIDAIVEHGGAGNGAARTDRHECGGLYDAVRRDHLAAPRRTVTVENTELKVAGHHAQA